MSTKETAEIMGHGFFGSCAPGALGSSRKRAFQCKMFSLGIFQWMPKSGGKGLKMGKAKVRVSGFSSNPEAVYARAHKIISELNAGTYTGPKNVRVK